mgnify:CR=1 FL=1
MDLTLTDSEKKEYQDFLGRIFKTEKELKGFKEYVEECLILMENSMEILGESNE